MGTPLLALSPERFLVRLMESDARYRDRRDAQTQAATKCHLAQDAGIVGDAAFFKVELQGH